MNGIDSRRQGFAFCHLSFAKRPYAPRRWVIVELLLGAIAFCAAAPVSAFDSHKPFDISADVIDYVDVGQEITAEGHVTVVQTSSTVTADFLRYDRTHQTMEARGNVIMRDHGTIFAGDAMNYDLVQERASVTNARGYGAPWLMQASSWEKEKDYYVGRTASLTNCELIDPHYHLRSSRVHLIPDRMFWAWNNVAYADKLPVFYSPFLYRDLDKKRVVFQVQPGNDSVSGAFAKTITTFRFTDHVYNRIYFDHYTVAGNGFGDEFTYQAPGKLKGDLFGYFIHPHANSELTGAPTVPQYNLRSYHWQKISDTVSLQSNANLRKNVSFNNLYFPQDTNQGANDITSSIALTQQTRKLNHRLVVEALNAPDLGDPAGQLADTHTQNASLPRYDFTAYQFPIWSPESPKISSMTLPSSGTPHHLGPLVMNLGGTLGQFYQRADDRTHDKANTNVTLSDTINLSRNWTLTPSFTPQLNWQDKFDPTGANFSVSDFTGVVQSTGPGSLGGPVIGTGQYRGFQARIGQGETLRWRATSNLSLDTTYNLVARLTPNSTALDRSLSDGGIERNHVTWFAFFRPSRSTLVRSFSGYDFRNIADESLTDYKQRKFDPWSIEVTLQPRNSKFDYYFRHQLGYYPTRTLAWETTGRYHGIHRTILELGLLYARPDEPSPALLTVNNRVGIFFSSGWRLDAILHSLAPNQSLGATRDARFIDTEFILVRDMHCWQSQFVYRSRPPFGREFAILFDLKLGATKAKEITDQDLESQFYPWRAGAYAP